MSWGPLKARTELELEEFLMRRVDGDMKICVLQIDDDKPVSLRQEEKNGVKGEYTEFLVKYVPVEVS